MSEDQFNEAKKLIAGGMSARAAATKVGVSHTTLIRRLRKEVKERSAPNATAEPELKPDAEPWRTIRRHENETRKQLGLAPLTDAEWAAGRKAMEECNEAMAHLFKGLQ